MHLNPEQIEQLEKLTRQALGGQSKSTDKGVTTYAKFDVQAFVTAYNQFEKDHSDQNLAALTNTAQICASNNRRGFSEVVTVLSPKK